MFAVLRHEHDHAQSLLYHHISGRVRMKVDNSDDWLFGMELTENQLNGITS